MAEMNQYLKQHKIKVSPATRRAGEYLERRGKKFFVDFGYDNAESVARREYNFRADVSIRTLNGRVLGLIRDRRWYEPWTICNCLRHSFGIYTSDSSVTARLRDLRKPRYGAHNIIKRRIPDSTAYEYRLVS